MALMADAPDFPIVYGLYQTDAPILNYLVMRQTLLTVR